MYTSKDELENMEEILFVDEQGLFFSLLPFMMFVIMN